ncbi:c-type cytochrome biogenesis protein CcmI [Pseudaestuariivita sp.]|uniref:c-type cytochrome biogenesis protein CcmI n=1 Tax=Pseudaestuariivita sp. TaxID=2211669 RepID=UPI004057D7C4
MAFWGFWLATGLLVLVACAIVVLALRRGSDEGAQDFDVQVYRDQLTEVDRDLARGVLGAEDAERVRTEISRRILAADAGRQGLNAGPSSSVNWAVGGVLACAIAGGTYYTYVTIGAPGYGDFGLEHRLALAAEFKETRPSQAEAEADIPPPAVVDASEQVLGLVQQLREVVADRPTDLRGHQLLVQYEGALGNYRAAYEAQDKVLEIKGDAVTAADIATKAELMILAAGEYVSPEAEAVLNEALTLNSTLGSARYYYGLMYLQTGRADLTFRFWSDLLERGPEEAPWIPPIRAQIESIAAQAGERYTPPAPDRDLRGPTQDDIDAAEDLTPEERMEMIRGMVGRLSDKLATEGGTPQEWAQLIRSLVVIGDIGQARAVWDNAQEVFADTPGALVPIQRAAQLSGID